MYNLSDFNEYTNQDIKDKILLVWSKNSGYYFESYDEWLPKANQLRIVGVEK